MRRTHRASFRGVLLLLAVAALWPSAGRAAADPPPRGWDVEAGAGLVMYQPHVELFPKGSTASTTEFAVAGSIGRRLLQRLTLRLDVGYGTGAETEWVSETQSVTADIPTPTTLAAFLGLEAPLRSGGLLPFVGIGAGVIGFGKLDEPVHFVGTTESKPRLFLKAHTDPAVHFDLGALQRITSRLSAVARYRLMAAFSADQVNTLDRFTVAARVHF